MDVDDKAIAALNKEMKRQGPLPTPGPTIQPPSMPQHTPVALQAPPAAQAVPTIQVVQGDVTKQQVTGIVNPTNTSLFLAGRVSSNIAYAMGPGFQQTCDDF